MQKHVCVQLYKHQGWEQLPVLFYFILFKNLFKPRQHCLDVCMFLTSSVLSATSKLCFEQPAASFLVCSLIFIEYSFCSFTESYLSSIQAQVVLSYKLDKLTVIVPSDYKTSSSLTLEFNVVPQ